MIKLGIIGAGDLGIQILHLARQCTTFEVVAFFDDTKTRNSLIESVPVVDAIDNIQQAYDGGIFEQLVIAIGYKHMSFRSQLYDRFKGSISFANIIHPTAFIDTTACLGEGVVVYPGVIVDMNATIGNNTLLNIGTCIAHDSQIGDHSFISPKVTVAGQVNIGKQCNIGVSTTIIDHITIAPQCHTGGGTVVIKDLTKKGLYVGNPARFIR